MCTDLGIGIRHNSKPNHTHRSDDEHVHPVRKLVSNRNAIAVFSLIYERFRPLAVIM